ncbi:hypothetical protein ACPESN_13765 [Stutzerimonas marianensis]|uniref:hypothetical protein n=1 Tax=Stutzerimonas marianensis TaxID=2929513 RepID=UPI003C2E9958
MRRLWLFLCLMLLAGASHAADTRFSLVRTAQTHSSGEFAWRDGGWVEAVPVDHLAVLIEHQGVRLLFGTGLGRQVATGQRLAVAREALRCGLAGARSTRSRRDRG